MQRRLFIRRVNRGPNFCVLWQRMWGRMSLGSFLVGVRTNILYFFIFLQQNALDVHKGHAGHMTRVPPRGLSVLTMQCLPTLIGRVVFLLEPQHPRWFKI